MPFKPPEQAKCPLCGKSVYAAEEKIAAGRKWHKFCFKCGMCNKCWRCHGRKFGPKGYGFGGGAGALSTETGAQFGNKECEMSNVPKQAHDWHKSCCNCAECHKSLDATTLNKHEGEIYCKGCYAKNFGPHGYGVGTLAK
ncbi:hypothetical protein KUTeg_023181 [Tegillarca granosa]|uniref:LIM zinc-binding domain-containing protein n=1 Tax=Tegillarca granosa TaxID=220873 RepID=A0ABQ9E0W4_TEGGR|nr:hypothetical protein KUTeg_023181 [Tegillarca granosa]